jgi:abhydrolase domain-containing protein 12
LTPDTDVHQAHQLLIEDPEARVVINFHGNAGNVAQGYRPQTYRSLTSSNSKIHVITVDYRGFGRSTGVPSEAGLIMDGVALVNYVLSLGVPPERIVLLGQSLGTQVASAVALHFADYAASMRLLPSADSDINLPEDPSSVLAPSPEPITFGSVVLVASFPALNKLLKVYRLGGLIPILSPLRVYPYIQSLVLRFVHENWNTSSRLAALVDSAAKNSRALNVQIIHARDDRDIHYTMGQENFLACVSALEYVSSGGVETKSQGDWGDHVIKKQAVYKDVRVEWELFMSGGHNRIVADVPIALAVMRGLNI